MEQFKKVDLSYFFCTYQASTIFGGKNLMFQKCCLLYFVLCLAFGWCIAVENRSDNIKALYVAANLSDISSTMNIAKKLKANAIIIDIKDDWGKLTCKMDIKEATTKKDPIADISEKLKILKKNGFYTIARIVSFKDFTRNDLAIKKLDGSVWVDKEKYIMKKFPNIS